LLAIYDFTVVTEMAMRAELRAFIEREAVNV
jgi:hypothetical protein